MPALSLLSHALCLLSGSKAQYVADNYETANLTMSEGSDVSTDDFIGWGPLGNGVGVDEKIRVNVTEAQQFGALLTTSGSTFAVKDDRPSILRFTLYGDNPTAGEADLILSMSDVNTPSDYFSAMLPLNGEASAYNNMIGPLCDSAQNPESTSVLFEGSVFLKAFLNTNSTPLYAKVGPIEAEWQPTSKLNAWPIVLEMENHPMENYSIVRLMSNGSDVVQECGFGEKLRARPRQLWIGGSTVGMYMELYRIFVQFWYNDTMSPTTSPTTDPTAFPTENTSAPTGMPSQTPTGAPSDDPTADPTQNPTQEPTVKVVDSADEKESSDDGLAIGLGVAGGVVALLIVAAVVYFLVMKKK